jgi:hypothetical protein
VGLYTTHFAFSRGKFQTHFLTCHCWSPAVDQYLLSSWLPNTPILTDYLMKLLTSKSNHVTLPIFTQRSSSNFRSRYSLRPILPNYGLQGACNLSTIFREIRIARISGVLGSTQGWLWVLDIIMLRSRVSTSRYPPSLKELL